MRQSRKRLIRLFIGNMSNSVVHAILEKAVGDENIRKRYDKELATSLRIAMRYRRKINPAKTPLPEKDLAYIQKEIARKARSELKSRISKGYLNINLGLIERALKKFLKDAKAI